MLHKRSRIDFTMDTLDNDKDEDNDNDYKANAGKTAKRICKTRLGSKTSQKNHSVTSKKFNKKNLKMAKQGKISKNSGNSVSQDISGSIFDKSKDTGASEKLSVKKGTKKKAITDESQVGTIGPKTVRGDKQQIETPSGTVEKSYKCSKCSDSFESLSKMTEHVKIAHQILKPHKCSDCGSNFSIKQNLKCHINESTEMKTEVKTEVKVEPFEKFEFNEL